MIVRTGDELPEIKAFLERRLGIVLVEPARTLGFMTSDGQRALCAVALNDFNGANIELTVCAEPGGATRGVMRYVTRYVFEQLKCRRLTVRTKRRNRLAGKMALRCGFKFEGIVKAYFPDDDAVVYRMTKDDCRWM